MPDEADRLRDVASWYLTRQLGIDRTLVRFRFRAIRPFLAGRSGLELGSAEGLMTPHLLEQFETLTIVEGAAALLAEIPEHPRLVKVHALFEDFRPHARFGTIVMDHVLEHVADPRALLGAARGWLEPEGRLIAGVPNAWSLHRLAAVHMGLLPEPTALNDRDHAVGHRRVYTPDALRADVEAAGLAVQHEGGVFLKPLSNAQMEGTWSEAMLEAFDQLGADFPRNAAEIFIVCG